MDKLYSFIEKKIYVMTLVNRDKRQIVGYDIEFDRIRERIQGLVNNSPKPSKYYSDNYLVYSEICYESHHTSIKVRHIPLKVSIYSCFKT